MTKRTLILFIFSGLFWIPNLDAREYDIADYLNPNNPDRRAYIEKYKDIAMAEMSRAGIPASIKLAQGILESGDGKSTLANEANNHFGMKCGAKWEGNTFYLKDDDYDANGQLVKSCFRVFETPQQSYYAHSEFLHNPKKAYRYGYLFDLDIRDYRAWAKGLKAAGYATNPRYPQLLIGIIEANKLYEYDLINLFEWDLAEGTRPKPETNPGSNPNNNPVASSNVSKNEVVLNNGVRMIFAQSGDTPNSIENLFGVKAKKVTIYNELYEGGSLTFKEGDRIYLQSKRKRWRGKTTIHQVKPGETMYSISQLYGMKVCHLYKRNRMIEGTEPAIGQKISLRRKISRNSTIRLRDPSQDVVPEQEEPIKELNPRYDLSDGKNIVDVIRTNVNAFDMEDRVEAYLKITEGAPTAPPYTPPTTTPTYPTTTTPTYPVEPEVVTPSYPTQPTQPTVPVVITTPTPTTPSPPVNSILYHTVESGDTLYAVARKYNIQVAEIKRLNGLASNVISIGQRLRVR